MRDERHSAPVKRCKRIPRSANGWLDRTATGRTRTDDLRFTKPLLYQLSYGGTKALRRVVPPVVTLLQVRIARQRRTISLRHRQGEAKCAAALAFREGYQVRDAGWPPAKTWPASSSTNCNSRASIRKKRCRKMIT